MSEEVQNTEATETVAQETITTETTTVEAVATETVVEEAKVETPVVETITATETTQAPVVEATGTADTTASTKITATKVTATKVVAKAVTATPVVTVAVASTEEELIAKLKALNVSTVSVFVDTFENYVQHMAPGVPVSNDDGAKLQYGLWKAFQTLINNTPVENFKVVWGNVLSLCMLHSGGALGERYAFRFAAQWSQQVTQLTAYQALLNLVNLTANPNTRAVGLKQIDLNRALATGYTERGRQNLLSFYGK